jgi:hypothetical protein
VLAALAELLLSLLGPMALAAVALAVAAPRPMAQAVLVAALDCLALDQAELPTQEFVAAAVVGLVVPLEGAGPLAFLGLEALLAAVLAGPEMLTIQWSTEVLALSASSGPAQLARSHRPIRGTCNA